METDLREAIVSGVFVEFCDQNGNCVAQSVYLDWSGRPVPAVGDELSCSAASAASGRLTSFSGSVRTRHFDVQRDAQGSVSVYVRLVVDLTPSASSTRKPSLPRYAPGMFSAN